MFASLLPFLVTACFSLAAGFLTGTPIVWIERPVLGLIWDVASPLVKDADVRRVHAAVHTVAAANGPVICGLYQVVGMVLSVVQARQRGFDRASVLVAAIALVHVVYSLRKVGGIKKSAQETSPAGEAGTICAFIRNAMMFHYTGFITCTIILILQLVLVTQSN